MSLRRFINFFGSTFAAESGSSGRRLKEIHRERSQVQMRGALMQAARQPNLSSHVRVLQTNEEPLMRLELNDLISLSFDFNFGDGSKDLLFGIQFHYDGGDSLTNSYVLELL